MARDHRRTMPDMLPRVLRTDGDASGKTFSLKYSSVTPQTWCNVSTPRRRTRNDRAEMSAAHKPSSPNGSTRRMCNV